MHIGFVGSRQSWYLAELVRASAGRHRISPLSYEEISAEAGNSGASSACRMVAGDWDAAILRSMPAGSLEQIVFRMDALAQLERSGVYLLNAPKSMEVAIDKFLSSSRLTEAELLTPRTHVSQHWPTAVEGFEMLGGDVVVKPLFGGEGRGITRISDPDLAERAFKMLTQIGAVIYQQQFIEHEGADIRILVLGDSMWGMRRHSASDWRTNVSRGATTEPLEVTSTYRHIARHAADAVGAVFAGVDVLEGRDGKRYVLEVNAVPGWKALAETLNIDIAAEVLAHFENVLESRR